MLQCQWIKARQTSLTVRLNICRRHLQAAPYRPSATVTSKALAPTTQSLPLPPLQKIKNPSIDRTQQIQRHLSTQPQSESLLMAITLPILLPIYNQQLFPPSLQRYQGLLLAHRTDHPARQINHNGLPPHLRKGLPRQGPGGLHAAEGPRRQHARAQSVY